MTVAEILGNKKRGLKIYDLLHRIVVEFDKVTTTCNDDESETVIWCKNGNTHFSYSENGTERGWLDGMQILKPSECMQDWDKLAWKQGDVLVDCDGTYAMFDGWSEDDFSEFNTKYSATPLGNGKFSVDEDRIYLTSEFNKIDYNTRKHFINLLEKEYNGKFDPETLEIDKQPKFKEGDIVYIPSGYDRKSVVFIYKSEDDERIYDHATYVYNTGLDMRADSVSYVRDAEDARFATEEEKRTLFNALKEVGKKWDADKKQIVDLPKKCEFKAFDKVLAKFDEDLEWMPDFFYYYDNTDNEMPYVCVANGRAIACIPYNDQTAHLLCTTDEWEGGER